MQHLSKLLLAAIAMLLFCASCHRKDGVVVVSRNFQQIVDEQQNLDFGFNRDLYPDSLLQRWDSTEYIRFSPAVHGAFKWTSSSELRFSPAEGFQPGQDYTATVTRAVLSHLSKPLPLGDGIKFHFRTAPLHVSGLRLFYTRSSGGTVVAQLDLDFNYAVRLSETASRLRLSSKGNNVPFTALSSGTGKTLSLQFAPLSAEDKETPLNIELAKGVPLARSSYASERDTSITAILPSRFTLRATGISSQHNGMQATISLSFSQPVQEEGLKNFIHIEPSVPFEVRADQGGITVTSDSMRTEQSYLLTIDKGLEGALGGHLKESYSETIAFGKPEPAIHFANQKGMYLSSRGYRNLALQLVSVPAVQVTVVKVYENNISQLMRRGYSSDYGWDERGGDYDGGSYSYYETQFLGDTIFSREYRSDKLPGQNSARILHLDFEDKIRDRSGVYVISVADKDHYWVQESKILSLSDIGLIVKEERDRIHVFASSIRDAKPLSGADISFFSTNNQLMGHGKTDGEGMVCFDEISKKAPGFHTGLITARIGDEYSFIWLPGSRIETSRYDVGGRQPNATGLNAMIYAERNLYRPGETAHVTTIIRDENWKQPGEIPVKLRLVMPNGREFGTMRKILNGQGSTETIFPIPPTALTGTYTLEVYSGNDVLLNAQDISVEDFIPDRLKASLHLDRSEYSLGDSVQMQLQADNLFGTPAMNRNWEAELNLSKGIFSAKGFEDFDFGITKELSLDPQTEYGQTDAEGAASARFGIPEAAAGAGLLQGRIFATVFDETGRPVHRYENFKCFTQPYFIGVKSDAPDYISTGALLRISLAAVGKDGRPVSSVRVHAEVIKHEWNTVIEQHGDHYRYVSQETEKRLEARDLLISGSHNFFAYSPALSGSYELRFSLPGADGYVSKRFYAWGYGSTSYSSFEVNNEGNVEIKPDKESYRPGEEMKLLFTAPFDGRMLVTIERERVMKHYFLQVENKSASLRLNAGEDFAPNVYVSATLTRPMDGSELPLTVAHGFRNLRIENPQDRLPLQISAAEKTRSKTRQTIAVKTLPHAYVTIAAVDEGILQIKSYTTPDPFVYFYQKVALSVGSYDIYPLLLPELKTTRMSTGGDGAGADASLRVNPLFVNRVKNVSFWSGILQADGNGNLRYTIDIPQFSGDIRIMAAAYKDHGFAGAERHMKVADPIVISAALPRVLSPRDVVQMSVTLSNTTANATEAQVSLNAQSPLQVQGAATQRVSVPPNGEARVVFRVAAQNAIGAGKATVSVQALGEVFTNETELAVRPPASLQKRSGSGSVPAGQSARIAFSAPYLAGTASGKLVFGKSPLVPFSKNLQFLIQYPYGCIEQTVSAAFPQLYYADLSRSLGASAGRDENPAYNVQQAISKLQAMQMSNGALMYWPDGGEESWWGSIYAAHFLLEAKKAGYAVNQKTLDHLLGYLKAKLQKRETEVLRYNRNMSREIAAKGTAYSLYVLALAGEPQPSTMNYYKGNPKYLAIDSRYLLAAAYTLSGQPAQARQIMPSAFAGEQSEQALGGSFYSYTRDLGLSLNALLDVNPQDPQVPALSRLLSQQLQQQHYLNTQENVWGILALGKLARFTNRMNATATLSAGGKGITSSNGGARSIDLKSYLNSTLTLGVKGSGTFYYFWETSGITADGSFVQEDATLKVRRAYYTRSGQPISGSTFRQNELVVVKLTLQAAWSRPVENVVVTDMLPAGFEIENMRLSEMPGMSWIKSEATPDYIDYRDDRVNIFTTAYAKPQDFYYLVRAVSPGTFQLGPVQADAMYNGALHSYWGAGVVKVE